MPSVRVLVGGSLAHSVPGVPMPVDGGGVNGRYVEHVVVRSAVWVTVSHWMHGHPWAFPLVIAAVAVVIVRSRWRLHKARQRRKERRIRQDRFA